MKTRLVVARSVQRRAFRCPPRSVAAAVAISLAFCAAADASDGGASKVTKCPSAARGPNASKSPDLAEQDPSRNSRTWDGISRGVLPPPHYVYSGCRHIFHRWVQCRGSALSLLWPGAVWRSNGRIGLKLPNMRGRGKLQPRLVG